MHKNFRARTPMNLALYAMAATCYFSCTTRNSEKDFEESSSDALAAGSITGGIGPVKLSQDFLNKFTNVDTRELATNYLRAVEEFKKVYGTQADPYFIPVLRAGRFIAYQAWNKNKEASNFNPITMTDKYNFDVDPKNRVCRKPDNSGRPANVWMVFEKASRYVQNGIIGPLVSNRPMAISQTYRQLPYVQKASPNTPASTSKFSLDFFLALHVENGEGAINAIDGCSKIGQFRSCDGVAQSPFFNPFEALKVCRSNDPNSALFARWRPSSSEWQVILSRELRNLGQLAAPMPSPEHLGQVFPEETAQDLPGESCSSPALIAHLKKSYNSEAAIQSDWPGLKRTYPSFTSKAMRQGAAFLGEESSKGRIEAFNLHSQVRQIYKDVVNFDLKGGLLDETDSCSGCALQRNGNFIIWDVEFERSNAAPCPKMCLKAKLPVPGSQAFREQDTARPLFEPSKNDTSYRSISSELDRFFNSMKNNAQLSADPIDLGAELQRWFVAMHPFTDGNGRTSRFIKEIILHASGLPMPIVDDFWSDTGSSLANYQTIVRKGIKRHIEILNACTRFQKCKTVSQESSCTAELQFSDPNGLTDTSLRPLDCFISWERDPEKAKFSQCQ